MTGVQTCALPIYEGILNIVGENEKILVLGWSPVNEHQRPVEKACPEFYRRVRQRRSRPFAMLTYCEYAPRAKGTAALPEIGRASCRERV